MARIIEGRRRIVKLSTDDILDVIRQYQQVTQKSCCYEHLREILDKTDFYIPED